MQLELYKSGIYKAFIAFAVLLVAVSLFQIPDLKLGVEFKGGSLVIADSSANIDEESIKEALLLNGISSQVTKFKTPEAYRYEVEISNPDYIFNLEQERTNFESLYDDYVKQSYGSNTEKIKEAKEKIVASTERANGIAKSLNLEGENLEGKNINEVRDAFISLYEKIRAKFELDIKETVQTAIPASSFSLQIVSPLLSSDFTKKAVDIAIFSAVLVSIFIFYIFRKVIPSLAVLIGAFCDLIICIGGMSYFGIPLTLASFAALLMVVGYSLDTNILLTIRTIKRKENLTAEEKAQDAFNTGITMTITAILAFSVILAISHYLRIALYSEIASVALIGLIADIAITWGINAMLALEYLKRSEKNEVRH